MYDSNPGKPLYVQVRESLAGRIASGEWPPGSKLPGELTLCRLYSVSRITIRQALKELEDEGCIERKQGRGTTVKVRQFEQRLSGMYSFSEELMKRGAVPTSRVLEFKACNAPDDVASRLQLQSTAPIYAIKRLRMAGNEPYAVETSYLPQALMGSLSADAVQGKGLYNAMRECTGIFPRQAEETFFAAALPQECALLLCEKRNSPAMVVERVAFWRNVPVEYCVSWVRADKFKFNVTLGPPGRARAVHIGGRLVDASGTHLGD